MEHLIQPIAKELKISFQQVKNTLQMLEEGNTIPFIARYRKEMTQGLDEEQIRYIEEQFQYQKNLLKRKEDVKRLIETQGKLTEELKNEVDKCITLSQVDDIYRPYQQKRKTRATDALAKGLQPLADWLLACPTSGDARNESAKFLSEQVASSEDALQGALDIIAEKVSDDAKLRQKIREFITTEAKITVKIKKNAVDEDKVYKVYYDYNEKVTTLQAHRIMAIDRGEREKILNVSFEYNQEWYLNYQMKIITKGKETIVYDLLFSAVKDGLKRLVYPSIEREIRSELTDQAHEKSIDVFSNNLERLLMQPPLKYTVILGVDPAFRTGCKLAVIDETGKLLAIDVIYPHAPVNKKEEAAKKVASLVKKYNVSIAAIGNGTASRESEAFIAECISTYNLPMQYAIVSEAGASVYSAGDVARAEFPDLHVEQRSAVSIARRLLDPLSELIKIDPKSIGVGQYQHDLPPARLQERLDFAVTKTVNRVGADVNTASEDLLRHVAGFNRSVAKSLVDYRNTNGAFKNRKEILKVNKLGAKLFEQAAGFLRIPDATEILDRTAIHPESYGLTKKVMSKLGITDWTGESNADKCANANVETLAKELDSDVFTIGDILSVIMQPLRDYRDSFDGPLLHSDILSLEDLKEGLQLEGVVRNVTDFGAFVDIGLKNDGLVHISKMSKGKISSASDLVSVGDIVQVTVIGIDHERHKVSLSMI